MWKNRFLLTNQDLSELKFLTDMLKDGSFEIYFRENEVLRIFVLSGGHIRISLKGVIKSRFRIKTYLIGNIQN